MHSISDGKITSKLLKLFKKDDPAWDASHKTPAPSARAVRGARGRGRSDGANRSDHQ